MRSFDGELLLASRTGHYSRGSQARVAEQRARDAAAARRLRRHRGPALARTRLAVADALISVAFAVAGPARGSPYVDR